jgi:hypothetical protein
MRLRSYFHTTNRQRALLRAAFSVARNATNLLPRFMEWALRRKGRAGPLRSLTFEHDCMTRACVADIRNAGATVDNSQDFRCSVMDEDADQDLVMRFPFI